MHEEANFAIRGFEDFAKENLKNWISDNCELACFEQREDLTFHKGAVIVNARLSDGLIKQIGFRSSNVAVG